MTTATLAKTAELFGKVQPPAYENAGTPVSGHRHWAVVAAALRDQRDAVAGLLGPDVATAAAEVAEHRMQWELTGFVIRCDAGGLEATARAARARRQAAAVDATGEIPVARRRLENFRETVARLGHMVIHLRRELALPYARDPYAQQGGQREAAEVELYLERPAPDFADEDQEVAAAAALARQASQAPTEDVQIDAADILYTVYPHIVAAATRVAEPGIPTVQ